MFSLMNVSSFPHDKMCRVICYTCTIDLLCLLGNKKNHYNLECDTCVFLFERKKKDANNNNKNTNKIMLILINRLIAILYCCCQNFINKKLK